MASSKVPLFSVLCLLSCSDSSPGSTFDAPLTDGPPGTRDAPVNHLADSPPGTPTPDASVPPFPSITLGLQQVATGFSNPVMIAMPQGETRYFIAEKTGTVSIVNGDGTKNPTPFIDLVPLVATLPTDNEQGLLGLAFHPSYQTNGRVFVYWSGTRKNTDDGANDTHVWEFHRGDNADSTDPTPVDVLHIPHPDTNHNGGNIQFGPDGKLYIGVGDGGGAGGQYCTTRVLNTRLSKLLRIDVDHGSPYSSPSDNPFFGLPVVNDPTHAANDIWMWGLRNPWRWSFDRETGDLWIGDVGQNIYEEIDVARAGQKGLDFQWDFREGFQPFSPPHCDGLPDAGTGNPGTPPVSAYSHSESGGDAIVGGFVYRGSAIPELKGMYFFSDNGGGFIRSFWSFAPVAAFADTKNWSSLHQANISTFAETPSGELLFCSISMGKCWQIVKAASDR